MAKSILTDEYEVCFVDGCYNIPVHEHHLIFGSGRRKLSEDYGLKVPVCLKHHQWCHELSWKYPEYVMSMKMIGQLAFEEVHGTREYFMMIFRRNYLGDVDD